MSMGYFVITNIKPLPIFLISVVTVGWEQSSYEASEAEGTVTVCANLAGQTERDISVTATSADGSATGKRDSDLNTVVLSCFNCLQLLLTTQQ